MVRAFGMCLSGWDGNGRVITYNVWLGGWADKHLLADRIAQNSSKMEWGFVAFLCNSIMFMKAG